jgi:hypothetical protein
MEFNPNLNAHGMEVTFLLFGQKKSNQKKTHRLWFSATHQPFGCACREACLAQNGKSSRLHDIKAQPSWRWVPAYKPLWREFRN